MSFYIHEICMIFFIFLHVFLRQTFQGLPKKKRPFHQSDNSQSKSQPKSCFKSTSHVELNGRTRGGGGVLRSLAVWWISEISDEILHVNPWKELTEKTPSVLGIIKDSLPAHSPRSTVQTLRRSSDLHTFFPSIWHHLDDDNNPY